MAIPVLFRLLQGGDEFLCRGKLFIRAYYGGIRKLDSAGIAKAGTLGITIAIIAFNRDAVGLIKEWSTKGAG